jgi:anaerobic magnesium-protoporphyrin IX monomethyl ester cyclase
MTARPKVLFYQPYCFDGFPRMPLPLMAVARMVDRARFEPVIIDSNVQEDAFDRLIEAAADRPVLVGMSVMPGDQVRKAFEQSKILKEKHPDLPIVWGGYFPSLYPESCLKTGMVDVLVKGYGEETFSEILKHYASGGTTATLKGIAGTTYFRDGKMVTERKRSLKDLNLYPALPYDLVDVARYVAPTWHAKRNVFYVSSQGCPYGCGFCAIPAVGGRKWAAYSPERVVADVRFFVEQHGVDGVTFGDTEFFVSEDRIRGIAEGLIEAGRPVTWWAMGTIARLVHYRESTWKLMEESRCAGIFVGAESGSDETLKVMGKPSTVADTVRLAEIFNQHSILPEFSFVLGYPPHPEKDIEASLALIHQLRDMNHTTHFIPHVYTPLPDTGNYELATDNRFAAPTTLEGWMRPNWLDFGRMHHPSTPWLEGKQGRFLHDFERFIEYSNRVWANKAPGTVGPTAFRLLEAACRLRWETGFFRYPYELRLIWKTGRAIQRLIDGEIPLPGRRPPWKQLRWRGPSSARGSRVVRTPPRVTAGPLPIPIPQPDREAMSAPVAEPERDGRRRLGLIE